MSPLTPLETLLDAAQGAALPLPPELATLYGRLSMPSHPGRPHLIGNFVTSLDGVVSLNVPGQAGGGEISGFNPHDRMTMGLLRAAADAVVVGAGTLRATSSHLWTPEHIFPALAKPYQALRAALNKPALPLNVIVTARGEVDVSQRVFSGLVPALIITTSAGARLLSHSNLPAAVQVASVPGAGPISARAILDTVRRFQPGEVILTEGGPRLMGDFFAEGLLDELFLTLAPQVAGRDGMVARPGFISGQSFAPERPIWGTLVGIKRGGSHLLLRYSFGSDE